LHNRTHLERGETREKIIFSDTWVYMSWAWLYRDCASDSSHSAIFSCDGVLLHAELKKASRLVYRDKNVQEAS
jgi:hypothetical protein